MNCWNSPICTTNDVRVCAQRKLAWQSRIREPHPAQTRVQIRRTQASVNMDCDCPRSQRVRPVPESVLLKKGKTRSHQRAGLLGSMRISAGMERVYVVAAPREPRKARNFYSAFRAPRSNDGVRLGLTTAFLGHSVRLSVHVRTAPALRGSRQIHRSNGPAIPPCWGKSSRASVPWIHVAIDKYE